MSDLLCGSDKFNPNVASIVWTGRARGSARPWQLCPPARDHL